VESQIHDMLATRAPTKPTVEEARAVLAEMDPPESYADEEKSASTTGKENADGLFESGKLALWFSLGSLVTMVLFAGFIALLMSSGSERDLARIFLPWFAILFLFQVVGLVLGRLTKSRPCGKAAYTLSMVVILFMIVFAALTFS
jgi:Na+-driven multidrug efflux pump